MALLLFMLAPHVRCQQALAIPRESIEQLAKAEMLRYQHRYFQSTDANPADSRIDVAYYKLDLRITVAPNYIRGVVTMKARSLENNLSSIVLDLMNSLTVDSVRVGGVRCNVVQSSSSFTITLNRPYSQGEVVTVETFYRGIPGSSGFGSFMFGSHNGTPWIWTLSEPYGAKDWWPCKDHQIDKADSVDIIVTCDSAWKVGANGKLISVVNNGDGTKTHTWRHRYPIATYLVSLTITDFAQFSNYFRYSPTDSMEVLNYVLPEHLSWAQSQLPLTVGMLQIFSNLFRMYPFVNEKYGHTEFGWGGAMEHQTMTSTATFDEDVVAHELAHQWFGDMITCQTWPDLWINEGFAEYCNALYREAKYGVSGYWNIMNSRMTTAKQAIGSIHLQDTSGAYAMFIYELVYCKGASVLHMLRRVMGDSLFFFAMRTYSDHPSYKYATASTADFRSVCESVSGMNLGYFFNQWIYGERYPSYTYSWSSQPVAGGYDVSVQIAQTTGTSNPPFFTMPLDLRFSGAGWDTTVKVFNNAQPQTFVVFLPLNPTTVQLDPMGWILRDATLATGIGEGASLPRRWALKQNYPNPFNPVTEIGYEIGEDDFVTLKILDVLGREVATLVNERRPAGRHTVRWDAKNASSGVYFYRCQSKNFADVKKMLLMK
jgi:aminopeptidase N